MKRVIDLRPTPPASRATAHEEEASTQDGRRVLNSPTFAFITVVNNETQYATCLRYIDALQVPPGYSVEKIAVFGATSMAEGCQRGMEASTAQYKIYVHQDVYLVHHGLLPELLNLFRTYPRLGMVGVVGATRLPASAIWWVNNVLHSYGRIWEYVRPGGFPLTLLGPFNRRRLHFMRFRPFVGDYLPAVAVDGLFMATQYDIPWSNSLGGFELYDEVQGMEFIKAGFEVGIARQEAIWLLNWGPLQERSREQRRRRDIDLFRRASALRQQNPARIGVPVRKLLEQHGRAGALMGPDRLGERLGVVIVTFKGQETLLRALRALLPQCDALKDFEYQVVVVDSAASTESTVEAVRRESSRLTVLANASDGGAARAFNAGLRYQSFPSYVLIMHDNVEFSDGALARMVSYLREHSLTAGVVASLSDRDGTVQSQRMAIVELVSGQPRRSQPITFVGTTCALVRGEVFFDVGLFDERFHSHREDLDWSLRAKRKGYKFAYLPEAKVIHYPSAGSRQPRPTIFAERAADNLWFVYKHAGRRWAVALYWVQRIQAWWLAFRCRHDREALCQITEAIAEAKGFYRRFREENRRPQFL